MIKIKNVSKTFRPKKVLDQVSFTLENQIYGLLGPNGSGKTTLLRIMTHIITGDGEMTYTNKQGEVVSFKDMHIGYLPQKFGLYKELTLHEQMNYFACLKDIPKNERSSEIQRVLEAVNMYEELDKKCGTMSGGMIRRIGIAQAMMGNPDIILFDEPTAGLDPEERLRFKSILTQMRGQCPIVLSTHIVEDVESICQAILILKKGKIIFDGSLVQLKEFAGGRVMEMTLDEYAQLNSKEYYQIKVFEKDDIKYTRVLLLNNNLIVQDKCVEETIEDGYMYLLKKQ